jgi:hypothetical protein
VASNTKAHDRARWAQWLLGLGALLATAALWSSWQQVQLIEEVARGTNISDTDLTANDSRQQMFGIVQLSLGLVSAVVFLMWTNAHTKRLIELGVADMRYAPKWSVWGFIVPIINLFRPYQVMSELWKASDLMPGPDDPWVKKPTPLIVNLWFAILVVDNVAGRLISRASLDTIEEVLRASWFTVLLDALGVVTALIALRLVMEIDTRLRVSEERLAETGAPVTVVPAL